MPNYLYRSTSNSTKPEFVSLTTEILRRNEARYDTIFEAAAHNFDKPLRASGLILTACRDGETAGDTPFGGIFTLKLNRVWAGGRFLGTYVDFYASIARIVHGQTPTITPFGPPAPEFEGQMPFTI